MGKKEGKKEPSSRSPVKRSTRETRECNARIEKRAREREEREGWKRAETTIGRDDGRDATRRDGGTKAARARLVNERELDSLTCPVPVRRVRKPWSN